MLIEVQPQQDQQEGDTDNWARCVQEAVLDVVAGKECGKGDEHENTVNQISATGDWKCPNVDVTHVSSAADSTKVFNARQM